MELKKGQRVLWVPARPRKGSYGAAWGLEPCEVEIMSGPNCKGAYKCRVLDPKFKPPKRNHSIILPTHLVTNYEVQK